MSKFVCIIYMYIYVYARIYVGVFRFYVTASLFLFSLIRARERWKRGGDEARFLGAKDPRSVVLRVLAPDAMAR